MSVVEIRDYNSVPSRTRPEHPAARAWRIHQPQSDAPAAIRTLSLNEKSAVYRLVGAGPSDSNVIAKHCRSQIAIVERTVYEQLLPQLPIAILRYYGFIEESPDKYGRTCWLFFEDAGGRAFSAKRPADRALAARWLGKMHVWFQAHSVRCALPEREPSFYLEDIRSTRERILHDLSTVRRPDSERKILGACASQCATAESKWNALADFCAGMPRTLVHGDFQGKNVRIRMGAAGNEIFPLDWETAGWGMPGPDLEMVDPVVYWQIAREAWPQITLQDVKRLADYGRLIRLLMCMSWETVSLPFPCEDEAIDSLEFYQNKLEDSIRILE
jgi:hypothetical protein